MLEKRQYAAAVERLREAVRLHPGFIPALEGLVEAYRAMGRKQEAQAVSEQRRDATPDTSGTREVYRLFLSKRPREW